MIVGMVRLNHTVVGFVVGIVGMTTILLVVSLHPALAFNTFHHHPPHHHRPVVTLPSPPIAISDTKQQQQHLFPCQRRCQKQRQTQPFFRSVLSFSANDGDDAMMTPDKAPPTVPTPEKNTAAIIGAGPAGLATAIMLARRGMDDIHVYEKRSVPANSNDGSVWSDTARFYLIGLGGRGQKALQDLDNNADNNNGSNNSSNAVLRNNNNGGGENENTQKQTTTATQQRMRKTTHHHQKRLWDRVEGCCVTVVGRKDWAPGAGVDEGVERIFGDDRPYKTKVIPRDRLASVLHEVVLESYSDSIALHYDTEMKAVRWEPTTEASRVETAVITLEKKKKKNRGGGSKENQEDDSSSSFLDVRCELLVGADGTARTLAEAMEAETQPHEETNLPFFVREILERINGNDATKPQQQPVRIVRYKDDNRRVYKTVPMTIPLDKKKGWRGDVNYSARTKDGRVVFDALPSGTGGEYCAVLLLRADDENARADTSPERLRALLDETLPQFSPLVSDATVEAVAAKPPSSIPRFRYVGPALHRGGSTVLLGDAIHTVKPYFGIGVNSALEDVSALRDALDRYPNDRTKALRAYTDARAEEAAALVRISRGLDRPGFLGVLTFVVPIILDGVFQKLAPEGWFEMNTIALLQRDGIGFAEVGKIKRRDRVLQVVLLGLAAALFSVLSRTLLSILAGISSSEMPGGASLGGAAASLGLAVAIAGAFQVSRAGEQGMAPGDVLARTLRPLTDVISAEDRGTTTIADNNDDDNDDDDDDDDDEGDGGNKASSNPLPFFGKGGLPLL